MRFEPKIVRPSDPPELPAADRLTDEEFEARLPGELEFLAAQLRDDAAHLASVYPAGDTAGNTLSRRAEIPEAPITPPRRLPRRTVLAWSAAGTLASVVLALSAVSLPWVVPLRETHSPDLANFKSPDSARATPVEHREPALSRLVQSVVDKTDSRRHDVAGPSPAAAPALFLQNVSGPELEGLFDLWEEDSVEQSRISI